MALAQGLGRRGRAAALACAVIGLLATAGVAHAASTVFTVGNYPVEARAADAVAAKQKAMADGEVAALRSLLKRLVPVTAYANLQRLKLTDASKLLDGVRVRSERNSATEYIASLDFIFNEQAVKALLDREGLPYAETQGPRITIVPVWRAAQAPGLAGPQMPRQWSDAWKGLDPENSLAPFRLEELKPTVHPDTVKALAAGDPGMLRTFATEYKADTLLIAIAEPQPDGRRLAVTLIGQDAVGAVNWRKAYRIDATDAAYSIELAAVVSHRVLEGRWKAVNVRGAAPPLAGGSAGGAQAMRAQPGGPMEFAVEFRGMAEWAEISRRLSQTPGVEDLDVAGLSQRGARVTLRYGGGDVDRLADALSQRGLVLRDNGGGWVLSAR